MMDIDEALLKIRNQDRKQSAEGCAELAGIYSKCSSETALKALLSYLWDDDRYDPGIGPELAKILPYSDLKSAAMKHPDPDLAAAAVRKLSESAGHFRELVGQRTGVGHPKALAEIVACAAKMGMEEVYQEIPDNIVLQLKERLCAAEDSPGEGESKLFAKLLLSNPSVEDPLFLTRFLGRGRWQASVAMPLLRDWLKNKKAIKLKSDSEKRDFDETVGLMLHGVGERMVADNSKALRALLSDLDYQEAEHLASGLRQGRLSKSDTLDVDYVLAKKSGDPEKIILALRGDPARHHDEAVKMMTTPGEAQERAIRELLPAAYYKIDNELLIDLWDKNEDMRMAMVDAIGHKLPGRLLAKLADSEDRRLAAAAMAALAKKHQVHLLPLRLRDIEI